MEHSSVTDSLIESNLGFVVRVAKQFRSSTVPTEDLIGEGSLGLIEAARRYDPSRGAKFTTYAMWWVRKAMLRLLSESRTVRIPDYQARMRRQSAVASPNWPLATRCRLLSLDSPATEGSQTSLLDQLPDRRSLDPEEALLRHETERLVRAAMRSLTPRERTVVKHRFGLSKEPVRSLDETGARLGLSGERVRQIERGALHRMRLEIRSRRLAQRGAK